MHLTKYGLLLGLLIIMETVGLFCGHFGYTVNGVPQGGSYGLWESLTFLFNMVTFQVDNSPAFISAVFVIMSLMVVLVIIALLRGTD